MRIKYIYQQLFSHIGVLIVAFLVLSVLFTHYVETLVYQNKVDELTSYGKDILRDLEDRQMVQERTLTQYSNVLEARKIQLLAFDSNGILLYPRGRFQQSINLTDDVWNKISNGEVAFVKHDIKQFKQEVSLVVVPYIEDGLFLGGILLASPISGSREMISQINQYLLYTVLLALAVALLLSWLLSRLHVKRIKRIQEATSLVATGDYTVHVPPSRVNDEIGELANDFNQMVDKINTSMEEIESLENRRRQFIADVSHELRTPLTTISGVVEGIKNDMIPEGEKERGMNLVSQETKRLIRLVNENLDYDRIRSNQVKLLKENLQLIEVLEIIKEQLTFQADEKNNTIAVEAKEDIHIHADYDRLVQILLNITKNSIQFTRGGTIFLRGKKGINETVIEIEDTGLGIDPKEIEKIWHRFYKADISRTSNPYGEFGLGLSIVKQLVILHNGKIEVFSEKDKGTKFVIAFPM